MAHSNAVLPPSHNYLRLRKHDVAKPREPRELAVTVPEIGWSVIFSVSVLKFYFILVKCRVVKDV